MGRRSKSSTKRTEETQSDADDRKSLDENAIASDTDWESETENNDNEQDVVVQASLDFHKQEVKKVEPRKSDLRPAEIDPKMRDVKEIRQQMLQMEQSDGLRRQLLVIRQGAHGEGKRPREMAMLSGWSEGVGKRVTHFNGLMKGMCGSYIARFSL